MNRVLVARHRYAGIRRSLDMHREIDRGLHDELTRTIQSLDMKLAGPADDGPSRAYAPDILPPERRPEASCPSASAAIDGKPIFVPPRNAPVRAHSGQLSNSSARRSPVYGRSAPHCVRRD